MAFGVAVAALTGVPAQHIDGQIALRLLEGSQGLGDKMLIEHHKEIRNASGSGPLVDIGHIGVKLLLEETILLVKPLLCGNGKARLLQALLHTDAEPAVDLTAAGAALYCSPGAIAKKGHLLGAGQGQDAVVFQQHHALTGNPADIVAVGLLTGRNFWGLICVIVNHLDRKLLSDGRGFSFRRISLLIIQKFTMIINKFWQNPRKALRQWDTQLLTIPPACRIILDGSAAL